MASSGARPGGHGRRSSYKAPTNAWCRVLHWMKTNKLLMLTLGCVILGLVTGFGLRPLNLGPEAILLISYPGELVMRLLKLMILPLIISSLVSGAARLNSSMNTKIAGRMLVYFALTSLLNAALGTGLTVLIEPGKGAPRSHFPVHTDAREVHILDSFLDLGRNIFTDNLFQSSMQQVHTVYVPGDAPVLVPVLVPAAERATELAPGSTPATQLDTNHTELEEAVQLYVQPPRPMVRKLAHRDGTNTLGIIFFCLIFGSTLGQMGSKAQALLNVFAIIDEAVMRIISGIMWLTPMGIASLVCGKVLALEDVTAMAWTLGWLVFTVILGVLVYQLFLMQLIYLIILRRNPYRFYWQLMPATLTAFATASTAAALPVTLRCMDRDARVDPRVSRFVLPIGCTINMDGTALFVAVACGFLMQLSGYTLTFGDAVTLCLAATAASFSSASVPSAALVLIFMVMGALDAPMGDVPLLFAIDWFLDRVRTTNNMLGDCYTAAVVEWLSRAELEAADALAGPEAGPGVASMASEGSGPLLPVYTCSSCPPEEDDEDVVANEPTEPLAVVVYDSAPDAAAYSPRGVSATAPAAVVISNGDARHA